jgi:hypothetical protein
MIVVAAIAVDGSARVDHVGEPPQQPVAQMPHVERPAPAVLAHANDVPITEVKVSNCAEPDRPDTLIKNLGDLVARIQPSLLPDEVSKTVQDKLLGEARELLHGDDVSYVPVTTTFCVTRTINDADTPPVWHLTVKQPPQER